MHIWEYCRRIIRDDPRALSTGAYGDEGKVFLELIEMFSEIYYRDQDPRYCCVAFAWASNMDIGMMSPESRDTITYLTKTIAARTEPMRLTMSLEELDEAKAELFRRLDEFGAEPHELFKRIFEWYYRVIHHRNAAHVERGGNEWLLLQQYDLLACLGPWIIEVDEINEDAAEAVA